MRRVIAAILIGVVLFAVVPIVSRLLPEPTAPDVHELCGECGLTAAEIDRMIEHKRQSPLTREEEIREWESTYGPGELASERKLCLPCVEAILDAAGKTNRSDSW